LERSVREAERALLAAVVVHEQQIQGEIQAELEDAPNRIRPRLRAALRESRAREREALEKLGGAPRTESP